MTKLTKFLSLIPMVVLGAACNGTSPTATDNPMVPDAGASFDSSTAVNTSAADCKSISGVDLGFAPSTERGIVIKATYVGLGGASFRCPAPVWSSEPRGALIADSNPFKTRINSAFKNVTVFATAANGVQGSIQVGGRVDGEALACANITSVELKRVVTPSRSTVLRASYVALGGNPTGCAAPVWTSDPKGALMADTTNPFKTRVKQVSRSVTVFATAPNGVSGSISVTP